jgi:hypothetical protein
MDAIEAWNFSAQRSNSNDRDIEKLMYLWWYENRKKNPYTYVKFTEKQQELYERYSNEVNKKIEGWGV